LNFINLGSLYKPSSGHVWYLKSPSSIGDLPLGILLFLGFA
jgi:hypothetical protein